MHFFLNSLVEEISICCTYSTTMYSTIHGKNWLKVILAFGNDAWGQKKMTTK